MNEIRRANRVEEAEVAIHLIFNDIKYLRVQMTYGDLRKGCACSACSCPVARAICRAAKQVLSLDFDTLVRAAVSVEGTHLCSPVHRDLILPKRICQFITDYDNREGFTEKGQAKIERAMKSKSAGSKIFSRFSVKIQKRQ